jgi:hypothetical protein
MANRRSLTGGFQSARADEDGQDIIEFAIILPLLLLLLLGIIQAGILVWNYNTVANAAREGARYAIVHPMDVPLTQCPDTLPAVPVSPLDATCRLTLGLEPARVSVQVQASGCTSPGRFGCVRVTVTYDSELIFAPFLGPTVVPLGTAATMDREQ